MAWESLTLYVCINIWQPHRLRLAPVTARADALIDNLLSGRYQS